jgi:putative pyoverdin transport system ATP-binding/permease protein
MPKRLLAVLRHGSAGLIAASALFGLVLAAAGLGLIYCINGALTPLEGTPEYLGWAFLGVIVVNAVGTFANQLPMIVLGAKATTSLQLGLAQKILAAPLRRVEAAGASAIDAALLNDVEHVSRGVRASPTVFSNSLLLVACVGAMFVLSPRTALLSVVLFGLGTFITQALMSRYQTSLRRMRVLQEGLFESYRAVLEGVKELKLNSVRRLAFFEQHLEGRLRETEQLGVRAFALEYVNRHVSVIFLNLLFGLLLFAGERWTFLPREDVLLFALLVNFSQVPLYGVLMFLPTMVRADVALGRMEALRVALGEETLAAASNEAPSWGQIELRGVTHVYRSDASEETFTLGPIDLTLGRGELVFLVGGNGSGKSTLAKLIAGLYEPQQGEIVTDGTPVTPGSRDAYRQSFSAVFSRFCLFDELDGFSAETLNSQVPRRLEALRLSHKVKLEEGRFNTTQLSQGQRKRLALLVALLEDRPIYVFDEWAADQDPGFKEYFYRQVLPELKAAGKTVIAVSHDDAFFDVADRCVKLEAGKLLLGAPPTQAVG